MAGTLRQWLLGPIGALMLGATCIKLLLVPAYHSTDFEVHRNWLAITHSLPVNKWYLDETSPWTLDYPPFFAWFEFLLSLPAPCFDPLITNLTLGLDRATAATVLYQRLTVIASDTVLWLGSSRFCRDMPAPQRNLAMAAVILSPGLFIVDHIHFQYNGMLLGLLLLSLALLKEERHLLGGLVFSVLVCTKHLFAVAGPLYTVYLLRVHVRGPHAICNFALLAFGVLAVVAVAFGPFIYYGQLPAVLARLFPFGRGLTHAYWAPNAWALYNFGDKVASLLLRAAGRATLSDRPAAFTGGLVGETGHAVLPEITPHITALLVLIAMLPCLLRAWKAPSRHRVAQWVAYANLCGFMFGWHVHEKAALTFVIPLALLAAESEGQAGKYLLLSTVAHYSLFPLLHEPKEYPIKLLLLLLYAGGMTAAFRDHFSSTKTASGPSAAGKGLTPGAVHTAGAPAPDKRALQGYHVVGQEQDGRQAGRGGSLGMADGQQAGLGGSGKGAGECAGGFWDERRRTESEEKIAGPLHREEDNNQGTSGPGEGGATQKGHGNQEQLQPSYCTRSLLSTWEKAYLAGLVLIEVYGSVIHHRLLDSRLPFLPLLLTSTYCSVGMMYVWVKGLREVLIHPAV